MTAAVDTDDWLENVIDELNGTEYSCAEGEFFICQERCGSVMLDRMDGGYAAFFATPEWEQQENTLSIEVEYEGFCEGWTIQIAWSHDWEKAVQQWYELIACQLPAMVKAEERLFVVAEHHRLEHERAEEERRKRAMRCPMCGGELRWCEVHEPGCVHCDSCWWCGHESDASVLRVAS